MAALGVDLVSSLAGLLESDNRGNWGTGFMRAALEWYQHNWRCSRIRYGYVR
jgi:hypothetical protein